MVFPLLGMGSAIRSNERTEPIVPGLIVFWGGGVPTESFVWVELEAEGLEASPPTAKEGVRHQNWPFQRPYFWRTGATFAVMSVRNA